MQPLENLKNETIISTPLMYFVDVILPLPLKKALTYQIDEYNYQNISPGTRVAVPFRKNKIQTGIIERLHQETPLHYQTKPIEFILDEYPIVTKNQMEFWQWIASYYLATMGEIIRAALPSTFFLESQTIFIPNLNVNIDDLRSDQKMYAIYMAIKDKPLMISQIESKTKLNRLMPTLKKMLDGEFVRIKQSFEDKYRPLLVSHIKVNPIYRDDQKLEEQTHKLAKAPKQLHALVEILKKDSTRQQWIKVSDLKRKEISTQSINALSEKGLILKEKIPLERILIEDIKKEKPHKLSVDQAKATEEIQEQFKRHYAVLLHGVTASGKTEVYMTLIEKYLAKNQQILYLLPEISLTSQILLRLKARFGSIVTVYHSKYNLNERTEVWYKVLTSAENAHIIVGARSALMLPFQNLGLIIIDEEHEPAYKQFDPAPRYNARDSAVKLAHHLKIKILLGSATPSIESTNNALNGKYGLVHLKHRYAGVEMPEINTIDMMEQKKEHKINGVFSHTLIDKIRETLHNGKQVILFQNRRGYAPKVECLDCGHIPQCKRCDVSLTYHQYDNTLRCHFCNYSIAKSNDCPVCANRMLINKGFGTQQIQEQVNTLFPNVQSIRMDKDSTSKKHSIENIIKDFSEGKYQILIGTQMVVKGLDFKDVMLVGVLDADHSLYFPDFRSFERTFQILSQVAGRAGRVDQQGRVYFQTKNPGNNVIQAVLASDYDSFYKEEISDRKSYQYPPFSRLIRITMKCIEKYLLDDAANWFARTFKQNFQGDLLGPVYPPISRIKNTYHKQIHIKIKENHQSHTKRELDHVHGRFKGIPQFRSVKVSFDVDPY
ncbi:MAG: primosomal protein N' [Flavobacteriaceae bacterium]|nr:primosomal protein N' [Flavobacteriaceae bacterium]